MATIMTDATIEVHDMDVAKRRGPLVTPSVDIDRRSEAGIAFASEGMNMKFTRVAAGIDLPKRNQTCYHITALLRI
jgi:hypothetical protein